MYFAGGRLHAGLQSVLDTAFDAVCVMDSNGLVVGWNEHAAKCFGWSASEAIGQRLSGLIIPEALRENHEKGLAHYLTTGEGKVLDRRIEVSALHRSGTEFPAELSITASEQFGERLFIGFVRDLTSDREKLDRQQRLLQESDHRVKNMLTVVSAIARQTARVSGSLENFMPSFTGRLEALARSHQLLIGKERSEVALSALAEQVLGPDVAEGRARFGGPELLLPPPHVLGLSMVLHELYTNAVKYGALCSEQGSLAFDWRVIDGQAELVWSENGPLCSPDHESTGFGNRMIAMAVKSDLGGTIEREWRPEGLTATIRFPCDD
jgi:PAS domain S-box-containing protein